ncbi:hypothetical protein FISHEDRAFT_51725 [Fistulina hepatica ATCC 64428]|uniref:Ribonuclease H2 subunit B n=1 Tax=Fistulina hepatica ATCC 64428 TaxID=1128425 RepID=A0A0D7A162_9AGAR|nr:hypothetical protein FISHEDRAFT_51725 [Fistulina hepatica ATCC 64428]
MAAYLSVLPEGRCILRPVACRSQALHTELLDTLKDAPTRRILHLPHPRTGIPSLFIPTASQLLEVQHVAPVNSRSWFLQNEVVEDGSLLVMTPIDPAFLLIGILQTVYSSVEDTPTQFKTVDVIFEAVNAEMVNHQVSTASDASLVFNTSDIIEFTSMPCTLKAMSQVCDTKEITPEITVYRYSFGKVLEYLRAKVDRVSSPKFQEGLRSLTRSLAKDGLMDEGKDDLLKVGRQRAACDLISQYVSPIVSAALIGSYDFAVLNAHVKALEAATAIAMNSAPPKSRKSKPKTINGTKPLKRKATTSKGVEALKKVNVSGMAKISDFFKKTSNS